MLRCLDTVKPPLVWKPHATFERSHKDTEHSRETQVQNAASLQYGCAPSDEDPYWLLSLEITTEEHEF